MQENELSSEVVEAIVKGMFNDPFKVLGLQGSTVRVFEPNAQTVRVITTENKVSLEQLHKGGLFAGEVADGHAGYQLEVTYSNGDIVQKADAYALGSTLSELDRYLLGEGSDMQMYDKLGAQMMRLGEMDGTRFAVWAPNAKRVSVVGDFNQWDGRRHVMRFHPGCGIWELFVPHVGQGEIYKYEVRGQDGGLVLKSDPVGFFAEVRPKNASTIWDINQYQWQDADWMTSRAAKNSFNAPMSVYELHLGSWQRKGDNEWLDYDDLIERLIPYVVEMGFTHIELLPIMEHPFDGSWGYQVVGYFAPTSRFGTPDDFMRFVDACHQAGIGVLLDWVPAHFPKDAHGLGNFDGTHLYEHADPRQGEHPDWGTYVFNYDRHEVCQFLVSNALFWLDKYHLDGLRVDAVASMLYLDFSRHDGQWIPNIHGGRENIGAIKFLRQFNEQIHELFPDTVTIAEESTDWAGTTEPISKGGLGFDMKWNMGWMHDSLQYMSTDPLFRPYHHGTLTFSLLYAFSEKFMLPFSHDEVVHLKKSMLDKMPGDGWQMFANLRALYGYMWAHPGKKLLFMGNEFAHGREWNEAYSLDWHLVQPDSLHAQMSAWVRDLNALYQTDHALWEDDQSWDGFEWLEVHDGAHSVLAFQRMASSDETFVVIIFNFTPVPRYGYRLGVPQSGVYQELLNSDDAQYGGSSVTNDELLPTQDQPWRGQPCSIQLTLPPLGAVFLKQIAPPQTVDLTV